MQKNILLAISFIITTATFAQSKFPKHQLSINAFRNPSIGLEYQYYQLSIHGGYYVSNFTSGVTTEFLKTGLTYWFLPIAKKENPSSFYIGSSFLRGLTLDYKDKNAICFETGLRWFVVKGLNLRIGVIALLAKNKEVEINPTPSIGYSIKF